MKKLMLALLLVGAGCWAQIVPVNSGGEIVRHLKGADEETLVIFDIDEVLIANEDPAFRIHSTDPRYAQIEALLSVQPEPVRRCVEDLVHVVRSAILVSRAMPRVIQRLQARGVPTMALTLNIAGVIPICGQQMSTIKFNHLERWGINFSCCAVHDEPVEFPDLLGFHQQPVTYLEGVLFSSGIAKGPALIAFLNHTGLRADRVIFVDDRLRHLVSVEEALRQFYPNIRFLGLHYTEPTLFDHDLTAEQILEQWQALVQQARDYLESEELALQ